MRRALRWLAATPDVHLEAASSLHVTAPVGPPQPPFVNAVARVRTPLAPRPLLGVLQSMERAARRRRVVRWGPRTLDLDLLWIEGVILDDPAATLPHPRMAERPFVLAPLCELDPDLVHPVLDRSMWDLLHKLPT